MCTAMRDMRDMRDHSRDLTTTCHSESYTTNIPVSNSLSYQSVTREQQGDYFPLQFDIGPPSLSSKARLVGCWENFPARVSKNQAKRVVPESYPHSWICLGSAQPFGGTSSCSLSSSPFMEQLYFSQLPLQPTTPSQVPNTASFSQYETFGGVPDAGIPFFPTDSSGEFSPSTGSLTDEPLNHFSASEAFSVSSGRRMPPPASYPLNSAAAGCLRPSSPPALSTIAKPPASNATQSAIANRSPEPNDLTNFGIRSTEGTWRCAYPGCSSQVVFRRGCDLRKHFNRHRKHFFCRHKGCPQASHGGFSSKKDRSRHEAKHNPGIPCEWTGCRRVFSRMDNMKDHVRRIHSRERC